MAAAVCLFLFCGRVERFAYQRGRPKARPRFLRPKIYHHEYAKRGRRRMRRPQKRRDRQQNSTPLGAMTVPMISCSPKCEAGRGIEIPPGRAGWNTRVGGSRVRLAILPHVSRPGVGRHRRMIGILGPSRALPCRNDQPTITADQQADGEIAKTDRSEPAVAGLMVVCRPVRAVFEINAVTPWRRNTARRWRTGGRRKYADVQCKNVNV